MKIQNIPTMTDARFARLIKTVKSSSYIRQEDNGKTFLRYIGEPKITSSAGGPYFPATHIINIIDDNVIFLKTESTHSQNLWYLSDSQMKELVDALNSIPDVSKASY